MRTFKIHAIPDWHDAPQSHITFALVIEDDAGKHGTAVVTRGWLQRFRPMVGGYVSFSGAGLTGGTYSPIAPAKLALWGEEDGEKVPELAPTAPLTDEERALIRDLRNECTALKRNLDNATKARDAAEKRHSDAQADYKEALRLADQYKAERDDALVRYNEVCEEARVLRNSLGTATDCNAQLTEEITKLRFWLQPHMVKPGDRANVDATLLRQATERADRLQAELDALKVDRNRELREYIATRQFHQQQETRCISIPAAEISGEAGQLAVTAEEEEAFRAIVPRTALENRMDDLERRFSSMTANVGNTLDRHQHAIGKWKKRVKALEGRQ